MVQVKQIPRSAAFAWSPDHGAPYIATGTVAGTVDPTFSATSELELWDLHLDDQSQQGFELTPKLSVPTKARFNDLAWGSAGVITGALDNGELMAWDASKLLENDDEALLFADNTTAQGPIKALDFNRIQPNLLVSAGAVGEIWVWDLNNSKNPYKPGARASRSDDIDAVAWNHQVGHILATGGSTGYTTIWDLRLHRELLHLNSTGGALSKGISSVAWHPLNATKIITAMADDQNPVLHLWDLRQANTPERTLSGHRQGVLSVAWCEQDPDLLLSSGRDNRTLLWNPQAGQLLGEFPPRANWTFSTRWYPHNPNLLASASFDGKLTVHTLQSTMANKSVTNGLTAPAGAEFFSQDTFQDPMASSFVLTQMPKWHNVPVGANFGFGGKLITFAKNKVKLTSLTLNEIGDRAAEFEKVVQQGDWVAYCNAKKSESADWDILSLLISANNKQALIDYIGFKHDDLEQDISERLVLNDKADEKRLSGLFKGGAGSDFMNELVQAAPDEYGPFDITKGDNDVDKLISDAILFGKFDSAVDLCLKEDRMSDAFMLASCGDEACRIKVRKAYLSRKTSRPSYLRLLSAVADENLMDIARNANLDDWKSIFVSISTFAKEQYSELCEILGERLEQANVSEWAKFCYMAGAKMDKVVRIWVQESDAEKGRAIKDPSNADKTAFSIYADGLQDLFEKVTVFKQIPGVKLDGSGVNDQFDKYATILSNEGKQDLALRYATVLTTTKSDIAKRLSKSVIPPSAPAPAAPFYPQQQQQQARRPIVPAPPPSFVPATEPFAQLPPTGPLYAQSFASTKENWNDPPNIAPTSRRSTPAQPPINSPFTGLPAPPQISNFAPPKPATPTPLAPPPTGARPPQKLQPIPPPPPPQQQQQQQQHQPPPPMLSPLLPQPPLIPSVASPYLPPVQARVSSPYAPTGFQAQVQAQAQAPTPTPPPPASKPEPVQPKYRKCLC